MSFHTFPDANHPASQRERVSVVHRSPEETRSTPRNYTTPCQGSPTDVQDSLLFQGTRT